MTFSPWELTKIKSEFSGFSSSMDAKVCSLQPNFLSFAERLLQHFLFKGINADGTERPGFITVPLEEALLRILEVVGSTLDEATSKAVHTAIRNSLYKVQVPFKIVIHKQIQDNRVMAIYRASEKAVSARIDALKALSNTYDAKKAQLPASGSASAIMHQPPTPTTDSGTFKVPEPVRRSTRRPGTPKMGLFGHPIKPSTTAIGNSSNNISRTADSDNDGNDYVEMD